VSTGQLLSLLSLFGRTTVTDELVEMRYGIDQPPTSAFNGTDLTDEDLAVTDVQKAGWCEVTRPFYGLDDGIRDKAQATADEALHDYLK
jgi:hypothetical protein